jgi:HSP20 family protein
MVMTTRWLYAPTRSLLWPGFEGLDSLFEGGLFGMNKAFTQPQGGPRFVWEDLDGQIILRAELPGMTTEDVELSLEDEILRISGKSEPTAPEGYKSRLVERTPLTFSREFSLSDRVDTEQIEAEMKNGILTVRIPRREELGPKKISIKAS